MSNRIFVARFNQLATRFALFWIIIVFILVAFSNQIAQLLVPSINFAMQILAPDFHSILSLSISQQDLIFQNEMIAMHDIYLQKIPIAPKDSRFIVITSVFHSFAPISMIVSSSFIFRSSVRLIFVSFSFSILFSLTLILMTSPFILLNNLESQFYFAALNFSHRDLPQPLIISYTALIELGGQWLLAIIFTIANCVLAVKLNE